MTTKHAAAAGAAAAPASSDGAVAPALDKRGRPLTRTYTLATGESVVQRRGDGNLMTQAERMSTGRGAFAYTVAYLSLVTTINGEKAPFEELLAWDAEDLLGFVEKAGLGFFGGAQASSASPPS